MKHLHFFSLALILLLASSSHALLPPPTITLSEHIKRSTYIFVGEVTNVYFVSRYGKRIMPSEAKKEIYLTNEEAWVETKILVKETLLSREGKLPRYVYFRHIRPVAGYFPLSVKVDDVDELSKEGKRNIGKKYIWFANSVKRPKMSIFFSSYGLEYDKDIEQKAEIQALIEEEKFKRRPHIMQPHKTNSMTLLN